MHRRTGLSDGYAKRKEGGRRDEAKCHPERTIHELREEANCYQSEEFEGHVQKSRLRGSLLQTSLSTQEPPDYKDNREHPYSCNERCAQLACLATLPIGSLLRDALLCWTDEVDYDRRRELSLIHI